eukprot:2877486-Rhodomonas_salina.1
MLRRGAQSCGTAKRGGDAVKSRADCGKRYTSAAKDTREGKSVRRREQRKECGREYGSTGVREGGRPATASWMK